MYKFIFALNKQTKDKLILLNYRLVQEQKTTNGKIYIFENKKDESFTHCNFSDSDYFLDNTLFFNDCIDDW